MPHSPRELQIASITLPGSPTSAPRQIQVATETPEATPEGRNGSQITPTMTPRWLKEASIKLLQASKFIVVGFSVSPCACMYWEEKCEAGRALQTGMTWPRNGHNLLTAAVRQLTTPQTPLRRYRRNPTGSKRSAHGTCNSAQTRAGTQAPAFPKLSALCPEQTSEQ